MEKFERAFFGVPFRGFPGIPANLQLRTNVTDAGDHYLLEADLPGFEKTDIALEIRGNKLFIHAQRKTGDEEKGKVIPTERSRGTYTRRFHLSGVDTDKITAKYVNGVLKLTLPKLEQPEGESRRLEIE